MVFKPPMPPAIPPAANGGGVELTTGIDGRREGVGITAVILRASHFFKGQPIAEYFVSGQPRW